MPTTSALQHAQRRAFGERLRALRADSGLSQEEFAHRAELDRSYVASVERGERNVSLDNVYRLASALGLEPRQLF